MTPHEFRIISVGAYFQSFVKGLQAPYAPNLSFEILALSH